jgi:tetratricopeptide (TPR) repeat protein
MESEPGASREGSEFDGAAAMIPVLRRDGSACGLVLLLAAIVFVAALPVIVSAETPPDAMSLYRQGRDLEYQGRTAAAMAAYSLAVTKSEQAIASNPRDMESQVVLNWSLFRLGKHQEVLRYGQEALKISFDPRIAEVLGESSYLLGQNEEALGYLQKYIETAEDSAELAPNAYYYMGEAYMRLKKFAHADIAFTTALAKAPSMYRWWYRLGFACEAQGQYKRAYDAFVKSLSINPRFEDAIAGRDRVKAKAGL